MDKPIMWLAHFVGWVRTSCVKSSIFCSGNAQELIFSWEILSELAGWPKIESQQQVDRIHLQMSEKWVSAPISLFSPFPHSRQSSLISSDCTPILLQKSRMSLPVLECWNVFFFFLGIQSSVYACMFVLVLVFIYMVLVFIHMRIQIYACIFLKNMTHIILFRLFLFVVPSCFILKAAGWITTFVIF
jgi:hypothetical protein